MFEATAPTERTSRSEKASPRPGTWRWKALSAIGESRPSKKLKRNRKTQKVTIKGTSVKTPVTKDRFRAGIIGRFSSRDGFSANRRHGSPGERDSAHPGAARCRNWATRQR